MQDRFKFRVWDLKHNLMLKPEKERTEQERTIIAKTYIYDEWYGSAELELTDALKYFDNKPFLIMQCTGLKDKNGKLIYEGDIVKITKENWKQEIYHRFYIICWDRTQWQLGLIKYQRPKAQPNRRFDRKTSFKNIVSFADYTPLKEFAQCEIIGNIYENPELLKDGE